MANAGAVIVGCVAILALTALEWMALRQGIDGAQLMVIVALIAGIAAGIGGYRLGLYRDPPRE